MTVNALLQPLVENLRGDPDTLVVNRRNVLRSFEYGVRSGLSLSRPVRIKFSGEDAVDEGGPRREFFRSVAEVIQIGLMCISMSE